MHLVMRTERERERSIIVLKALSAYSALLLQRYIGFPKITEKS